MRREVFYMDIEMQRQILKINLNVGNVYMTMIPKYMRRSKVGTKGSKLLLQLWKTLKKMQIFETMWSHHETWLFQHTPEAKHQSV
jgi:hypothetical protein